MRRVGAAVLRFVGVVAGLLGVSSLPLPTKVGTLHVDPRTAYWHHMIVDRSRNAEELASIARTVTAGMVCYDIGAHLGEFSLALRHAAGRTGRIVAFEPNPALLPNLRRTLRGPECTVVDVALSATEGEGTLYVPRFASMASLVPWTDEQRPMTATIRVATIDGLVAAGLPRPDFIKCDTEGSEGNVFRGAETVLRTHHPVLHFEVGSRALRAVSNLSPSGLFELLDGFGYQRIEPIGEQLIDGAGDTLQNFVARRG